VLDVFIDKDLNIYTPRRINIKPALARRHGNIIMFFEDYGINRYKLTFSKPGRGHGF
jgi:hypothetical protein